MVFVSGLLVGAGWRACAGSRWR